MGKRKRQQGVRKPHRPSFSLRDALEVVLVIALLSVIAVGVHIFRAPGTLPIRAVHFTGQLQQVSAPALRAAVQGSLRGGFFAVELGAIERAIEALPWVDSAAVRRAWPNGLSIQVREQRPVARWGRRGVLNERGETFYPAALPKTLPVLYGPAGRQRELMAQYQRIAHTLEPIGIRLRALVEDERQARRLLLDNGVQVALGRSDPAKVLARLRRVFPRVLASRAKDIASIDLRYTNGFSVSWRAKVANRDRQQGAT